MITKHVDDWIVESPTSETERLVKQWLGSYRGMTRFRNIPWSDSSIVLCDYDGKRYRLIGCSRLGDVWLTSKMDSAFGYEKRVDVELCSNWEIRPIQKPSED